MYTLSYSHSLHANTGSEESTRRAGGLVTPNPSVISMGHPECPGRGPAPGASPVLGRVMGGTDQSPQCHWAGSPVGGVSLGRGQIRDPGCALLQDAGRASGSFAGTDPWLQHSSPRFRGTQEQLGWCCQQGSCPPRGYPAHHSTRQTLTRTSHASPA